MATALACLARSPSPGSPAPPFSSPSRPPSRPFLLPSSLPLTPGPAFHPSHACKLVGASKKCSSTCCNDSSSSSSSNPFLFSTSLCTSRRVESGCKAAREEVVEIVEETPSTCGRRDLGLGALSSSFLIVSHALASEASAFSIGFSGPKEWLKQQKRKAAPVLLRPMESSKEILDQIFALMERDPFPKEDILNLINSAARDCGNVTPNSIIAFQSQSGIEVCTFKLVLKNAASLLEKTDVLYIDSNKQLDELTDSFKKLTAVLEDEIDDPTSYKESLTASINDVKSNLDKFEATIVAILEA